MLTDRKL